MPATDVHPALLQLGLSLKQAGYQHICVSPASHARVNARAESAQAHDVTGVLGWSRGFLEPSLPPPLFGQMREAGILRREGPLWRSTLRLASLGRDLFFHSAYPTSEPDAVFFGPDTYRFVRALEAELGREPVHRAADLGCGAGPAAIVIARHYPDAAVFALDINDAALRLTALNAALAGARVQPLHSDLLAATLGEFDLIVANPPYLLDAARRTYRHGGGALGAGVALAIVAAALGRLAPGGRLLLYTGVAMVDGADPFLAAIAPSLRQSGCSWRYEEIDPDVFGEELDQPAYRTAERIAAVWLSVQRPHV